MNNDNTLLFVLLAAGAVALFAGGAVAYASIPVTDSNGDQLFDSNGDPIFTQVPIDSTTPPIDTTPPTDQTGVITMTDAAWKINDYPLYADLIANSEIASGIPQDLLARLLYQESHYVTAIINGSKRSNAGAIGIGQFMPATAASLGINPSDPNQAIPAAGSYLRQQYNALNNWTYALGAYNFGLGNMRKYLAGKIALPTETKLYMAQITADVPVA